MNHKLLIILFFFTLNCNLNKVSNTHGFRFIETKYEKIIVNKSNKNDIRKILGSPSSISKFDNSQISIQYGD